MSRIPPYAVMADDMSVLWHESHWNWPRQISRMSYMTVLAGIIVDGDVILASDYAGSQPDGTLVVTNKLKLSRVNESCCIATGGVAAHTNTVLARLFKAKELMAGEDIRSFNLERSLHENGIVLTGETIDSVAREISSICRYFRTSIERLRKSRPDILPFQQASFVLGGSARTGDSRLRVVAGKWTWKPIEWPEQDPAIDTPDKTEKLTHEAVGILRQGDTPISSRLCEMFSHCSKAFPTLVTSHHAVARLTDGFRIVEPPKEMLTTSQRLPPTESSSVASL